MPTRRPPPHPPIHPMRVVMRCTLLGASPTLGMAWRGMAWLQDVSLLVNLVRLVDYICCESQVALMQHTLERLREACERNAFLLTQVHFLETGMEFVSHEDDVRQVSGAAATGRHATSAMPASFHPRQA